MNCDGVRELLSAYVDGELAPGDLLRVEQHLRRCQSCAGEVDALRHTVALVSSLEEVELPADFHAKLHARLLREGPPKAKNTPVVSPWRRHVQWASAAAAAAVLGLSLASYQLANRGAAGLEAGGKATIAPKTDDTAEVTPAPNPQPPVVEQPKGNPGPGTVAQGGNNNGTKPTTTGTPTPNTNNTDTNPVTTNTTPPGATDTNPSGAHVASLLDDVQKPDPTVKMSTTTFSLSATAADPAAVLTDIQKLVPGAADPQGGTLTLWIPATGADDLLAQIKAKLGDGVTEAEPAVSNLSYQYDLQYKTLQSYQTQLEQLQKQRDAATGDARTKADEALKALKEQADRAKTELNRTIAQSQKVQILVTVKTAP